MPKRETPIVYNHDLMVPCQTSCCLLHISGNRPKTTHKLCMDIVENFTFGCVYVTVKSKTWKEL